MAFDPNKTKISIFNVTDLVHSVAGNFDGSQPLTDIDRSQNRIEWRTSTSAGLISPTVLGIAQPLRILRLQLFMAGQSTWTVKLVDGAYSATIATGTVETSYYSEGVGFLLGPQELVVTTTGAGTTSVRMVVTVVDANSISSAPRGF